MANPESYVPAFRTVKLVTKPVLKWVPNRARYFTVNGAIYQAEQAVNREGEKVGKYDTPPFLLPVIDLSTGEEALAIAYSVLRKELESAYPGDGYVGRSFSITQLKAEGKSYALWAIAEIEVEEEESVAGEPEAA